MSKSLDSYYFFSYLCTRIIEGSEEISRTPA